MNIVVFSLIDEEGSELDFWLQSVGNESTQDAHRCRWYAQEDSRFTKEDLENLLER